MCGLRRLAGKAFFDTVIMNAFRKLLDGETAKLESPQEAEHDDGTEARGTVVGRFSSRLELPVTLTYHTTITRSAALA